MEMDRPDEGLELPAASTSTSRPSHALAAITNRVVQGYAIGAAAWILVSDPLLAALTGDDVSAAGIAKGLTFVAVTSTILWLVLGRLTDRFDHLFARTVTAQRDLYGSILANSSDIVAIFGPDGLTTYVNDAVTDQLGWLPGEMVGRPAREFLHPADRASAVGFREAIGASGVGGQRTFLLRHRDGSFRAMEVRGAPIRLDGGATGVVINARDVTDRARSERLLRAALAEDVTGLPGLRMFMAEMDSLGDLRPGGLQATVALVDIDRFGDINELHGRDGGDEVLRELARRLEVAFPEALGVWRHGADEFVLVVLGRGAPPAPHAIADRVRAAAGEPVLLAEHGARVTVDLSVGVALLDPAVHVGGAPLGEVFLRFAESALLEAKRHPDRTVVHHPTVTVAGRARQVAELHRALEGGDLVVHYQPKVRLSDLRIAGAEALVRWQHPEHGLLPPAGFLDAVVEGNLSAPLLSVVLRDALGQLARWLDAPGRDPQFTVCVNVTADDLRRRRFVDDIVGAVTDVGVDPHRLCLELTEQAVLADVASAREVLDELRRTGIQIAIDDFGTGYSTLEHIRLFKVDELKIDKGFVEQLGRSAPDEAIVDSVLAIARRLGVRVTAEGIEHPTALAYLRERGCGLGQGFLFGHAVPGDEIVPGATIRLGA
jgi:PAS domain S-box-containing protein/diguanylate cyclase (GGDEF)-like protein